MSKHLKGVILSNISDFKENCYDSTCEWIYFGRPNKQLFMRLFITAFRRYLAKTQHSG